MKNTQVHPSRRNVPSAAMRFFDFCQRTKSPGPVRSSTKLLAKRIGSLLEQMPKWLPMAASACIAEGAKLNQTNPAHAPSASVRLMRQQSSVCKRLVSLKKSNCFPSFRTSGQWNRSRAIWLPSPSPGAVSPNPSGNACAPAPNPFACRAMMASRPAAGRLAS